MRYCRPLSLAVTLIFAAPPLVASFAPRSPGDEACREILSLLRHAKVAFTEQDDERYSTSRHYWNTHLNTNIPACIVYPTNATDVSVALRVIQTSKSRFAIKAGGHNPNDGFSSTNGGVLIDLMAMDFKAFDRDRHLCVFGPGSHALDLAQYYEKQGVLFTGPRLADIGLGSILGGGLSYVGGEYGLAVDNIRELEVVLPSGDLVVTSATETPDLFRGLRGGVGNALGIVTKFSMAARPAGSFFSGTIIFPGTVVDDVMEATAEFMLTSTDPRANIIAIPFHVPLPNLLTLDRIVIVFLIYHGRVVPEGVFDMFTRIPHLAEDRRERTFSETIAHALGILSSSAYLRGDQLFRASSHHIDEETLKRIAANFYAWTDANAAYIIESSCGIQPVLKSLIDASKAQGNGLGLPDRPFFWVSWVVMLAPSLTQGLREQILLSFKTLVQEAMRATDLPLFPNDSHKDQDPLATLTHYATLKALKGKYDPNHFFANYTGSFSLSQ